MRPMLTHDRPRMLAREGNRPAGRYNHDEYTRWDAWQPFCKAWWPG